MDSPRPRRGSSLGDVPSSFVSRFTKRLWSSSSDLPVTRSGGRSGGLRRRPNRSNNDGCCKLVWSILCLVFSNLWGLLLITWNVINYFSLLQVAHLVTTVVGFASISYTEYFREFVGISEPQMMYTLVLVGMGCLLYYLTAHLIFRTFHLFPVFVINTLKVLGAISFPVAAVFIGKKFNDPPSLIGFSLFAVGLVLLIIIFDIDMDYGITDALSAVALGTLATDDSASTLWKGLLVSSIGASRVVTGLIKQHYAARAARLAQPRGARADV